MKKNMLFTIIAAVTLVSCAKEATPQPYVVPSVENLTAVPAEGSVELKHILSFDAGNTGAWVKLPNGTSAHMETVVGPILGTEYKGHIGTGISMFPLMRGDNVRYESDGLLHVDGFHYTHGMTASKGKSWILRAYYVYGANGSPEIGIPKLIEVPGDWSDAPNAVTWAKTPWFPGVSFCTTTVSTSNSQTGYTITP